MKAMQGVMPRARAIKALCNQLTNNRRVLAVAVLCCVKKPQLLSLKVPGFMLTPHVSWSRAVLSGPLPHEEGPTRT
jgi:hypothetical protein